MKSESFTGEALVTFVVPIYNVEKYLPQCLDSILNQTSQNFKVILVNDGSTDNSGKIAESYAAHDERFTYVEQKNAGLGAARNTGMRLVKTPYVEFLDSDDWLKPRTIENVEYALRSEAENIDIVFTIPTVYNMATCKYEEWKDSKLIYEIFEKKHLTCPMEAPNMYALEPSVNRSVWDINFLRSHNFSFPEGVKWEDVFPHFYLFKYARRCLFVKDAGFVYRINSGGQITAMSATARLDIVPVYSKTLAYALENDWSEEEISYIIQMMMDFIRWSMLVSVPKVRTELTRQLHVMCAAIPKRYIKAYYRLRHPSADTRLFLNLLRNSAFHHSLENAHFVDFGERCFHCVEKLWRH